MGGIFILIASDVEKIDGQMAQSSEIAKFRLDQKYWPLHHRTRNRKIMKSGDKVLIYCGGQLRGGKSIIARAEIENIKRIYATESLPEDNRYLTGNAYEILQFREIVWIEPAIKFREILETLSFCPKNLKKWGVVLHGGARRISAEDYAIIMQTI